MSYTTASDTLMWARDQHETACQGSRGLIGASNTVCLGWISNCRSCLNPDATPCFLQVWEVQTEEVHILCK